MRYKPDHGLCCANGWTTDGSSGFCTLESVKRGRDDPACRRIERSPWGDAPDSPAHEENLNP
jgi:hypothetical protein